MPLSGIALPGVLQSPEDSQQIPGQGIDTVPEERDAAEEVGNKPKLRSLFPESWLWDILLIGWVGYCRQLCWQSLVHHNNLV